MTDRNYVPQTKSTATSQPASIVATVATVATVTTTTATPTVAPASTVEQNSAPQNHVEVPVNHGQQGFWQCFVDIEKNVFLVAVL